MLPKEPTPSEDHPVNWYPLGVAAVRLTVSPGGTGFLEEVGAGTAGSEDVRFSVTVAEGAVLLGAGVVEEGAMVEAGIPSKIAVIYRVSPWASVGHTTKFANVVLSRSGMLPTDTAQYTNR